MEAEKDDRDEETPQKVVPLSDVSSRQSFTRLLNRPMDPSSLGVIRFMFGFLMILDIPQERGLGHADAKWGDEMECRFPLFDSFPVPSLKWIYVMYFIMFLGAVGIMIGLLYRLSCLLFLLPYWYLFLLDKSSWNNHSYLYGLMALLLFVTDGNRYWSLDCWLKPSLKNAEIPLWNYTLFRIQIFLLYHIAGLKKFDQDWLGGYSMYKLSDHWVFVPFKLFLSSSNIDYYVVHLGGFLLDLTVGFFMFFDVTRIFAFFFCSLFNLMNSQMFTIGMFPYTMLATMPIFGHVDWPRTLTSKFVPGVRSSCEAAILKPSSHCLYPVAKKCKPLKQEFSLSQDSASKGKETKASRLSLRHTTAAIFTVTYILLQSFLPYSHFVTKGYNTWTNGLYGYSWDMMVHSWHTLHTRVRVVDRNTGLEYYLDPQRWANRDRWTAHADMAKQYARCMQKNLETFGLTNVSIYMDIWKSLNRRFQQRIFRPDVDILTAEWSPFAEVTWVMPLLSELSEWRTKLIEIEMQLSSQSKFANVVFFADFPDHTLDNYIPHQIENATLEVLKGQVVLTLPEKQIALSAGKSFAIPTGCFHSVRTVSNYPSCFFYTYVNTTEKDIFSYVRNPGVIPLNLSSTQLQEAVMEHRAQEKSRNMKLIDRVFLFWQNKLELFSRSATMMAKAVYSLAR